MAIGAVRPDWAFAEEDDGRVLTAFDQSLVQLPRKDFGPTAGIRGDYLYYVHSTLAVEHRLKAVRRLVRDLFLPELHACRSQIPDEK